MVQLGQVKSRAKMQWLRSTIRFFFSRPTKGKMIFFLFLGIVIVGAGYLISSHLEKKAIEKEARRVARLERLAALEAERNKPFDPSAIEIPESEFSFYKHLENRSLHIAGEESSGGAQYIEPPPKPKFELISQSSGYEAVDNQIKNELALELLSQSELDKPIPPPAGNEIKKKLQTGSFSSTFEANIHKSQLETMGYKPTIQKATVNGKTTYRVQIGPFTPKTLAEVKRHLDDQQIKFIEVQP